MISSVSNFSKLSHFILIGLVILGSGCALDTPARSPDSEAAEQTGVTTVALRSDLPRCNYLHRGVVFYVDTSSEFFYCDGWSMVPIEMNGANGKDGISYLVVIEEAERWDCKAGGAMVSTGPDKNDDGVIDYVTSSYPVCNGEPGDQGPQGRPRPDGKHPEGSSCTVFNNGNGTKTIRCEDGTSVIISDGKDDNYHGDHGDHGGCRSNDGRCPPGCNADTDNDCFARCGNHRIDPGETCDPPSSCPISCDDGTACTVDIKVGTAANCTADCIYQPITKCLAWDGCCPRGCSKRSDKDCSSSCGNGILDPGETCDPPSTCPYSCNDGNSCTDDFITGSAANCTATCSYQAITRCIDGDGCCPAGCSEHYDNDCSPTCGNGIVEAGETCDPPSACPFTCIDGNPCTRDIRIGSAANCTAACLYHPITQCRDNDMCCPAGCTENEDDDCSSTCGNGIVETGETCDPPSSCPSTCDDGDECTDDTSIGSAANCTADCLHENISGCIDGDGCCPAGCDANTDNDCSSTPTPICGNGIVEEGERCDPPETCPSTCDDDGDSCTIDRVMGNAEDCTAHCYHRIRQCRPDDGCCPQRCHPGQDNDC